MAAEDGFVRVTARADNHLVLGIAAVGAGVSELAGPVVKAQELKFSEKGVYDIVRKILLSWWNSYSFFANYANIDGFVPKGDAKNSEHFDQWVLSRLNGLIANTHREMDAYRLYNVVPQFCFNSSKTHEHVHPFQQKPFLARRYAGRPSVMLTRLCMRFL